MFRFLPKKNKTTNDPPGIVDASLMNLPDKSKEDLPSQKKGRSIGATLDTSIQIVNFVKEFSSSFPGLNALGGACGVAKLTMEAARVSKMSTID